MIDLIISGPDMSGTSSQVQGLIKILKARGKIIRDLRGGENEALFHAQIFKKYNHSHSNFKEYLKSDQRDNNIFNKMFEIVEGNGETNQDLKFTSMVHNECSTYINPNSADAWIMEEPSKRGAGLENRFIEQNRSKWESEINPIAAALNHQSYRTSEFLRFRKILRQSGKIIIRSRSEESACYQIFEKKHLSKGIKLNDYLELPGHKIAFAHPPTHIFIVCGPKDWTENDYLDLKKARKGNRAIDDHETNAGYQVLVNRRYATNWLENLYKQGCGMHSGQIPKIERFNIYSSREDIIRKMEEKLKKIV